MKILLPENVKKILLKLNQNGHNAYAVGGCIRDVFLGVTPYDWDITTSALPEQIKALFKRTVDTGLKHGTVTVLINKEAFEVTTYRIDGAYEDNRRPKNVTFTNDLIEDLKRRDFTINAMAYNENDGLIDVFNGEADIENKRICCVGDPSERFQEDALRMLRAIRFSAKLGFEIDADTELAIKSHAHLIQNISAERIHIELTKILISDNPHYIEKLHTLGLMEYVLPEFMHNIGVEQKNKHHQYTVDCHTYISLLNIEPTETLRWTMLLHDIGKCYCKTIDENGIGHFYGHEEKSVDLAKDILFRFRFDNKTKADVLKLIQFHDYRIEPKIKNVRRALGKIGDDLFEDYIKVQRADVMAQSEAYRESNLEILDSIQKIYYEIKKNNQCTSLKNLKINGKDLVAIGIEQGQIIGLILNKLLEKVIDDPQLNDREILLQEAKLIKEQLH